MKRSARAFVAPVLLYCLWSLVGCKDNPVEEQKTKAIDFILKDLEGNDFQLSNHYGKVILLDFFAVDDTTNETQIPAMSQIYTAHSGEGLLVVGISADTTAELDSVVDRFDLAYPVLRDSASKVSNVYIGSSPLPGIYLFDRDAVLQGYALGVPKTFEELDAAVKNLL
ncbi:MAG TPA: TlpA disulfide reductase family protein [Rhodothermales bacterium]|nr:TlpA disulfide reductase family protein [Rhodothermales bacterium]